MVSGNQILVESASNIDSHIIIIITIIIIIIIIISVHEQKNHTLYWYSQTCQGAEVFKGQTFSFENFLKWSPPWLGGEENFDF